MGLHSHHFHSGGGGCTAIYETAYGNRSKLKKINVHTIFIRIKIPKFQLIFSALREIIRFLMQL